MSFDELLIPIIHIRTGINYFLEKNVERKINISTNVTLQSMFVSATLDAWCVVLMMHTLVTLTFTTLTLSMSLLTSPSSSSQSSQISMLFHPHTTCYHKMNKIHKPLDKIKDLEPSSGWGLDDVLKCTRHYPSTARHELCELSLSLSLPLTVRLRLCCSRSPGVFVKRLRWPSPAVVPLSCCTPGGHNCCLSQKIIEHHVKIFLNSNNKMFLIIDSSQLVRQSNRTVAPSRSSMLVMQDELFRFCRRSHRFLFIPTDN